MNDEDDLRRVTLKMTQQLGDAAPRMAREQAKIADGLSDMLSAETWRDIADAIERLLSKLGACAVVDHLLTMLPGY
jgi:hypothetical protein